MAKSEIDLTPFTGKYKAPKTGIVNISIENDNLFLKATGLEAPLVFKSEGRFEIPGSGLEFQFVANANNDIEKFQVIENGKVVEEAEKL